MDESEAPVSLPVLNRGLDHIAIRAYDLDASVAFYTEALGFRFVREWALDGRVLIGLAPTDAGGATLDGRLTVLAADGLAPQAGAPVGQAPITIRTTPDGARAFVAGLRSGTVHVVDPADGSVSTVLDVDPGDPDTTQGAHGIACLP
ncbi:catechol 2,3-dioxygenase-like lactoylglutathione lyase family enzyme [Streptomyces tendae]